MEAAFTVMAIFTLSTIIVRIASTIMRLTGLPDNVARFQSLSAMTGTGFTTRESELIVNYPIRRRVAASAALNRARAAVSQPVSRSAFCHSGRMDRRLQGRAAWASQCRNGAGS